MAVFLEVPLKATHSVDFTKPLKNFIQNTYSPDKGEDFTDQIGELNQLRENAVRRSLDKHETALDILTRYHDQLEAMEAKLPICEGQISVKFTWLDIFDKGGVVTGYKKTSLLSAGYERACVLFNTAAMNSQIAAFQNLQSDENLKAAAKHFQQAAGIFGMIKDSLQTTLQHFVGRVRDLDATFLAALQDIMLAQAQEVFVVKARQDKMKDAIVAKIAQQAADFYTTAYNSSTNTMVKSILPKEWLQTLSAKQLYMQCIAQFYQSKVCKTKGQYGEGVARLKYAKELCENAVKNAAGRVNMSSMADLVNRELQSAVKDNDFIYNDMVPGKDSLAEIGKAALAKPAEISKPLNPKFQDLFEKLVPLSVLNAMSAFEARKVEIVSREIGKLRESTQLMNSVLASLNLPAAIEDLGGDAVPVSLLEKSREVKAKGGLQAIDQLFADLPELLQRNTEILDEAFRVLDEEARSDQEMKDKFKDKWTRLPSSQLTNTIRTEGGKYRAILNNAIEADGKVREKYNANRQYIEILSKSEGDIAAALPPASAGAALAQTPVVQELRELMGKVEAIKNEREVMESEIKNATLDMRTEFLSSLAAEGMVNEEDISNRNLDQVFGPLIQQVGDNLRRQEGILNNVQDSNTRFSQAKQNNTSAKHRDDMQIKLASAFDSYMELTANLQEGTKFYNDLTQILVKFQSKVSDLCFARKTEKEEMLSDLTQSIANQSSGPAPATPNYQAAAASSAGNTQTAPASSQPVPAAKKVPPSRPPPPRTQAPAAPPASAPHPAAAPVPQAAAPYAGAPQPGMPYQNPSVPGQQPGYQPMPSYAPYGGYSPMPAMPYNPYGQPPPQQVQNSPYPQQQYHQYPPQGYPQPGVPYGQPPSYNPYQQQPRH